MTRYFKCALGQGAAYFSQAAAESWVGTGWLANHDLTGKYQENWRDFNRELIPIAMEQYGMQSKVSAGLACGQTWTMCFGLKRNDLIVSPNGQGQYQVGRINGDYFYQVSGPLPHRRPIDWITGLIDKSELSDALRRSLATQGTVTRLEEHGAEIEALLGSSSRPEFTLSSTDVENPSAFALEKHLEEFLVANWANTELAKKYDIYEEDGLVIGQQYETDIGRLDILAISKDRKELLVIELKRGRVSDVVVGQIQRYMGFVKEELCEPGQSVRGVIIGLDEDLRVRRALSVTQGIDFYRYEINFKLVSNHPSLHTSLLLAFCYRQKEDRKYLSLGY
jgi:restriction system protein